MMKKITFNKGFTLIELLVSMIVIAIIGSVILVIFFSVLRGANKTNTIISVRQNGNYAISQISKILRESKTLSDPTYCTDGQESTELVVIDQDDLESTLSCPYGTETIILENSEGTTNLTDESTVSITNCAFSCKLGDNNTQIVNLSFTASQKGADKASEKQATADFKTSIVLRNSN